MNKITKFIFISLIAIVLIQSVLAESLSYSAAIHYTNGKFELKDILLAEAAPPQKSGAGEYTARLLSFSNNVLFETKFNVNLAKFYGLPVSRETANLPPEEVSETTIDLLLPYYPNGKTLQILRNEAVLLESDLSKFATCNENNVCDSQEAIATCPADCTCGNKLCDSGENFLACSTDCASGQRDGVCDREVDGLCDPDCSAKEDFDCGRGIGAGQKWVVYFGVVTLVVFGTLFLFLRRRKKD